MRKLKSYIFLVLIIFCKGFGSAIYAQTLTATASATTVSVGQQFQIEYSLNANGSDFNPPSFTGFVNAGYMQGGGTSSNGSTVTYSITYSFILIPQSEGTFTVGPATIKSGGKTITSNSLTIKVVKGAATQTQAAAAPQTKNAAQPSAAPADNKNIFVRLVPSKTKAYVGEEITSTLKIYYRSNIYGIHMQEEPDFPGFYTEDIPQSSWSQNAAKTESVNGVLYNVESFPQKILFPQRPGKLKIGVFAAEFVVDQPVRQTIPGFGTIMTYERGSVIAKSEPVSIEVLPLPKTKNKFSGAVGELSLKGSLDKDKVKANEAINLTITFTGSGNLKLIDSLPLQFPPDFDKYDPKISDHFTITASGVSGSRSFNYLLIPRHPGNYKIPAVDFTYFSVKDKSYKTLSLPEFKVDVEKGDNTSSAVTVSGPVNKEDVKVLGSDIRYIHPGHESFYRTDSFFLYSFPFFAGILAPLLLFIGFVIARRRYIELHKDTIELKRRGATRMAKKRLKSANKYIESGNKEVFYAELLKALNGYFSDKFTIPLADLSRDTISANLTAKNIKPETMEMVNKTLDDCEFARYAPATLTGNLAEVYASAVKLITLLEDEIS